MSRRTPADALDTLALALMGNKELRAAQARIGRAPTPAPGSPGVRRHAAGDSGRDAIIP